MLSFDFSGRTAVITGGACGIGRAVTLAFAQAGANVVIADICDDAAEKTAQEARELGADALAMRTDVTDEASIQCMAQKAAAAFGRIDCLINNAGIANRADIFELEEAAWDRCLDINLKSMWLVSRHVLKVMIPQGGGRIVNLGSITGKDGGHHVGIDYAVSKAGVHVLTKRLASDVADKNITVNAVAPHAVDTAMAAGHGQKGVEEIIRRVPVHRLCAPGEIAALILYLCCDEAGFITGQTIHINGGTIMVD